MMKKKTEAIWTEDVDRKNHNFVQIEKSSFKEFRNLIERNPNAARVLTVLAEKMNRENALMVSNKVLIELCKISQPTLTRCIALLRKENWIQIVKVGTSNAYVINSAIFWQSYGDKKYASFRARIIVSSEDQDEDVDLMEKTKMKNFPFLEIDPDKTDN